MPSPRLGLIVGTRPDGLRTFAGVSSTASRGAVSTAEPTTPTRHEGSVSTLPHRAYHHRRRLTCAHGAVAPSDSATPPRSSVGARRASQRPPTLRRRAARAPPHPPSPQLPRRGGAP